jgi:hypothetical protein
LDLRSEVESYAFAVKSHGTALQGQASEIEMLRHELLEQENMIFKLCMKGMFAFCYVCSRGKSVDC